MLTHHLEDECYVVLNVKVEYGSTIQKFNSYRLWPRCLCEALNVLKDKETFFTLMDDIPKNSKSKISVSIYSKKEHIKKLIKIYGKEKFDGPIDLTEKFLILCNTNSFIKVEVDKFIKKIFVEKFEDKMEVDKKEVRVKDHYEIPVIKINRISLNDYIILY